MIFAFFSVSTTFILLGVVLYRIHQATNRLVTESDNLRQWAMVTTRSRASFQSSPEVLRETFHASTEAKTANLTSPDILCADMNSTIQKIVQNKLLQVGGNPILRI